MLAPMASGLLQADGSMGDRGCIKDLDASIASHSALFLQPGPIRFAQAAGRLGGVINRLGIAARGLQQ